MNISLLFLLFFSEPLALHNASTTIRDPQSTVVMLARARALLEHLQKESPTPHKTAPPPAEPAFDIAAIVKPFFPYEGVAPRTAPQQSDRKTQ